MKKIFYDLEIYPNYFLVVMKDEKGKVLWTDSERGYADFLDRFEKVIKDYLLVGYNNNNYDAVVFEIWKRLARTVSKEELASILYTASKAIVVEGKWNKQVLWDATHTGAEISTYNLDLMSFDPQRLSLKEFGVRLHHSKLETLPFDPHKPVTDAQIKVLREYCLNDVEITKKLHDTYFSNEVMTKEHLITSFDLDAEWYSQSDRNITEHILCDSSLKPRMKKFRYKFPFDWKFKSQDLNDLVETYENIDFQWDTKFSQSLTLFGELVCDFGLGGIHAVIKNYQGTNLIDLDFASYYPNLIRLLDALPNTVKNKQFYYDMIDERVLLKKTDMARATAYKVVLNTVYGAMNYTTKKADKTIKKMGKLYDLENLYKITITGQLLLAKVMEDMNEAGYRVVYANTDGFMIEEKNTFNDDRYKAIAGEWVEEVGIGLEYEKVENALIRDVNNFIIIKEGGKVKAKGEYNNGLGRRISAYANISTKAVLNFVIDGTPIMDTIKAGTKIEDFVLYHKFAKQYNPTFIKDHLTNKTTHFSRVLRYYLSNAKSNYFTAYNTNTGSWINKENNENISVLKTLPDSLPKDIDYDRYLIIAYDRLEKLTGEEVEFNDMVASLIEDLTIRFE